jgi:hypothetical protein
MQGMNETVLFGIYCMHSRSVRITGLKFENRDCALTGYGFSCTKQSRVPSSRHALLPNHST